MNIQEAESDNNKPDEPESWNEGIIRSLSLDKKAANVNETKNQKTPLMWCVSEEKTKLAEDLLENVNIDINKPDNNDRTALVWSAIEGNLEATQILLSDSNIKLSSHHQGQNALLYAATQGHADIVSTLLKLPNIDVNCGDIADSALSQAAFYGHVEIVSLLLSQKGKININRRNSFGETALMRAAKNGKTAVVKQLMECEGVEINLLSEQHCKGGVGCTALHYAASNGHVETAREILMNPSVDIKIKNSENYTGMQAVVQSTPGAIPKELLDRFVTEEKDLKGARSCTEAEKQMIKFDYSLIDQEYYQNRFLPHLLLKSEREDLLWHPLFYSFVQLKWNSIRKFFYFGCVYYLAFVVLLSSLVLVGKNKESKHASKGTRTLKTAANSTTSDQVEGIDESVIHIGYAVLFFAVVQILKEMFEFWSVGHRIYLSSLVNWLDVFLNLLTIVFVGTLIQSGSFSWSLGAICVIFAWMNLLLFLRRSEGFKGLYVAMLFKVLWTLLKVIFVFSWLIFAFFVAFYALMSNQDAFRTMGVSYMKTFVMLGMN